MIPIIQDDYVVIPDPDSDDAKARLASGFLKVTPAHDPNDYDIGQRHTPEPLPIINVMAPDASISISHGWPAEENSDANQTLKPFVGLSREDARRAIVRWFKEHDLLEKQVPYRHAVGHSYRSHVAIEPYYSDQWYLQVTDDRLAGRPCGRWMPPNASRQSTRRLAQLGHLTMKTVPPSLRVSRVLWVGWGSRPSSARRADLPRSCAAAIYPMSSKTAAPTSLLSGSSRANSPPPNGKSPSTHVPIGMVNGSTCIRWWSCPTTFISC